ncbi:MAG TPA: SprT family zinc-dependent metalloprotease [Burkholderiales bacterium]|nr:SprT family zinc-dependent metalloprotease [Burkholderiales bacterium]
MSDLFPVTMISEPKSIRLRDRDIAYLLKRSQQRRSIVLTVDEHGLTVSAPWRSTEKRIAGVIRESEAWVLKKLDVWSAYPARAQTWMTGDRIKYLGRDLVLELVRDAIAPSAVLQEDGRLRIGLADPADTEAVKAAVVKWYRRHAQPNFLQRVDEFSARLGVGVPRVFLSSARTRWGSCNARREVRLNWRLIQCVQPTIDYVVVHELAHLIEMNHSRRFWKLVAAACPHYREACAELNCMGPYYMDL